MVEYSNCQKCQKCSDFTQIHPFLALLRMPLSVLIQIVKTGITSCKKGI